MTRLRVLIALILAVLIWSGSDVAARAHGAAGCVDHHEFLTAPWTHKDRLEAFWGTGPGRRTDSIVLGNPNLITYEYPTCRGTGFVVVAFRRTTWQSQQMYEFVPDERS